MNKRPRREREKKEIFFSTKKGSEIEKNEKIQREIRKEEKNRKNGRITYR